MKTRTPRVPIAVQVGVVAVLFAASLIALAITIVSVLRREGRRSSVEQVLILAGEDLATRGAETLVSDPPSPFMSIAELEDLHRRLAAGADRELGRYDGVEGGYFVREGRRFLGAAFPTEPHALAVKRVGRRSADPPPREYDVIETLVDASLRKDQAIFVVEAVPPSTVAIRTAPVKVGDATVGATWVMTRLVDPVYLDRSLRGYGLASGLALGGILLALALTVGLTRSLDREASERARLQHELRRSERLAALGRLLAGVAHEIRNPLAGIRAITQLWRRGLGVNDEAFEHLIDEVDRLEGIVSRLLQFSRADAQDLAIGDLNAVVAEAARLAEARAHAQGVRVELDLHPALPKVELAPPALVQVFRNLTTNALQGMLDGGVLRLATGLEPGRDTVAVRVSDTGPGLSAEVRGHLFEPFFTTKHEGTGLGLAIAREIALAHRGELRAENRPDGRGAVFTLTLPVAEAVTRRDAR